MSSHGDWISLHLYGDCGLRQILLNAVRPVLRELLRSNLVDGFFFVRYFDEGGAHVRLRLRLAGIEESTCIEWVSRHCKNVCTGYSVDFEPEVERYGGESLLAHSLEFFVVSSSHALAFESSFGDKPRSRRITLQLCVLLWQTWGFSKSLEEFLVLLDYFKSWRELHRDVLGLADKFFERNEESLTYLIGRELERLCNSGAVETVSLMSSESLSRSASALSRAILPLDSERRWITGSSHIHMMANRLGLTNVEESYCSRILVRAVQSVLRCRSGEGLGMDRIIDQRLTGKGDLEESLHDLAQRHLRALRAWI